MYQIQFHFFDSHQLDINVEDDLLEKFLDDLGQNRTFLNNEKTSGFWLQADKVRYFTLQKLGEPQCQNQSSLPSEVESALLS